VTFFELIKKQLRLMEIRNFLERNVAGRTILVGRLARKYRGKHVGRFKHEEFWFSYFSQIE
jgi:hypothetical protein